MSVHTASLAWTRGDQPFVDGKYSRRHRITFDGGVAIDGSSAPGVVRPTLSVEDAADPEELLVASLASCHMLFFLDFARRAGFLIDRYADDAEGEMGKDERGRVALTRVVLRPVVHWSGAAHPSPDAVRELHHKAHEACFIANSFRGAVVVEPRQAP
jgi:organic hydroperoxide reductase OsmC/OhrA